MVNHVILPVFSRFFRFKMVGSFWNCEKWILRVRKLLESGFYWDKRHIVIFTATFENIFLIHKLGFETQIYHIFFLMICYINHVGEYILFLTSENRVQRFKLHYISEQIWKFSARKTPDASTPRVTLTY